MKTYIIHPIALCEGPRDASEHTYRENYGATCNTACYVWYIEGTEPKILVDAGARTKMFAERGIPETDIISLEDGLAKYGVKPEDIRIVIVTHLHWDHIALGRVFKNARFIVQKKELEYARNAHPIDAYIYDKSLFEGLKMEVVDGEKEIAPGISVFHTPGHTPGGQSVEVNTTAGKVVITGMCCTLDAFKQTELMKKRGWEVSAPLIHQDVRDAYDSVRKIKRRAKIVLAIHDPSCITRETVP